MYKLVGGIDVVQIYSISDLEMAIGQCRCDDVTVATEVLALQDVDSVVPDHEEDSGGPRMHDFTI